MADFKLRLENEKPDKKNNVLYFNSDKSAFENEINLVISNSSGQDFAIDNGDTLTIDFSQLPGLSKTSLKLVKLGNKTLKGWSILSNQTDRLIKLSNSGDKCSWSSGDVLTAGFSITIENIEKNTSGNINLQSTTSASINNFLQGGLLGAIELNKDCKSSLIAYQESPEAQKTLKDLNANVYFVDPFQGDGISAGSGKIYISSDAEQINNVLAFEIDNRSGQDIKGVAGKAMVQITISTGSSPWDLTSMEEARSISLNIPTKPDYGGDWATQPGTKGASSYYWDCFSKSNTLISGSGSHKARFELSNIVSSLTKDIKGTSSMLIQLSGMTDFKDCHFYLEIEKVDPVPSILSFECKSPNNTIIPDHSNKAETYLSWKTFDVDDVKLSFTVDDDTTWEKRYSVNKEIDLNETNYLFAPENPGMPYGQQFEVFLYGYKGDEENPVVKKAISLNVLKPFAEIPDYRLSTNSQEEDSLKNVSFDFSAKYVSNLSYINNITLVEHPLPDSQLGNMYPSISVENNNFVLPFKQSLIAGNERGLTIRACELIPSYNLEYEPSILEVANFVSLVVSSDGAFMIAFDSGAGNWTDPGPSLWKIDRPYNSLWERNFTKVLLPSTEEVSKAGMFSELSLSPDNSIVSILHDGVFYAFTPANEFFPIEGMQNGYKDTLGNYLGNSKISNNNFYAFIIKDDKTAWLIVRNIKSTQLTLSFKVDKIKGSDKFSELHVVGVNEEETILVAACKSAINGIEQNYYGFFDIKNEALINGGWKKVDNNMRQISYDFETQALTFLTDEHQLKKHDSTSGGFIYNDILKGVEKKEIYSYCFGEKSLSLTTKELVFHIYNFKDYVGKTINYRYYDVVLFPSNLGIKSEDVKTTELLAFYNSNPKYQRSFLKAGCTIDDLTWDWRSYSIINYLIDIYVAHLNPDHIGFSTFNYNKTTVGINMVPAGNVQLIEQDAKIGLSAKQVLDAYVKGMGSSSNDPVPAIDELATNPYIVSAGIWFYYRQNPIEKGKDYWAFYNGDYTTDPTSKFIFYPRIMEVPEGGLVRSVPIPLLESVATIHYPGSKQRFDTPETSADLFLLGAACHVWGFGPFQYEEGMSIGLPNWVYTESESLVISHQHKDLVNFQELVNPLIS